MELDRFLKEHPGIRFFSNLVEAANMYDLFDGKRPVTLFLPTDNGFMQSDAQRMQLLRYLDPKILVSYHTLPGIVTSNHLTTGYVRSLYRDSPDIFLIRKSQDDIQLGNSIQGNVSFVIQKDIQFNNALVHLIDFPLVPPVEADICWNRR